MHSESNINLKNFTKISTQKNYNQIIKYCIKNYESRIVVGEHPVPYIYLI